MRRSGQVLTEIRHGGRVLESNAAEADRLAHTQESINTVPNVVGTEEVTFETPFDYLFTELENDTTAHLPATNPAAVVAALKALGDAMVENAVPGEDPLQPVGNSTIPPVYTYWGQFIDHDLTANTDRDSTISDITKPDLKPLDPE